MLEQSQDPRVLVVDDEQRVAETYRLRLEDDYDVEVATSGKEALEVVDHEHDVVLLDRRMPGVTGDEVLAELNSRDIDAQIVMVTAVEPDPSVVELQCTDYVVKPVENPELSEVVERALALREYSDRRQELGTKKLKRNVLEVELSEYELEESEQYHELNAEIERLEREVDSLEADLGLENVDRFV
ncbi:MAG: response regulator [Haloarculaceae archaeon]